jgi:hypothetical protein
MHRLLTSTCLVAAVGFAAASSVSAQTDKQQQNAQQPAMQQSQQRMSQQHGTQPATQQKPPLILLRDWNYDQIYGRGWSVQEMLDDATVYGPDGDDIGNVANVIVSEQGRVLGIIAEVGGFADIGDTHVFVPWDQIEFADGLDRVEIPVTEDNVEEYAYEDVYLKKDETGRRQVVEDDLLTGPRVWKATEFLDDRAFLNGWDAYGWVTDLIFTNDGKLHAVIANADAGFEGGDYAFPYYGYGYGWTPGAPYYNLYYGRADIADLEPFDRDKMNDQIAMQNGAGSNQTTGSTSGSKQSSAAKQQNN